MDATAVEVSPSGVAAALLRKIEKIASAVEGRPWIAILSISGVFIVCSLMVSATRLLWFDELHLVHAAQLPSVSDVLRFYASGLDVHTPLCALIERGSIALLGNNFVGLRAPYILSYLLFCLCLYRFVCTRTGPLWGLAAMTFPLVSGGLYYATEARPYAIVLGLAGFATICWQQAEHTNWRGATIALLWLSLTLATAVHYYAVFLTVPFLLAELSRWRQFRRADWTVAMAIASTPLILAVFIPSIQRSRTLYAAHFWAPARWAAFISSYDSLLSVACTPIVIATVLCALVMVRTRESAAAAAVHTIAPSSERTLAWALALLPFVIVPASFVTGAFSDRFVLPALAGITFCLIFLAWRACNGNRVAALAASFVFLGWFIAYSVGKTTHAMADTGGYPFRTAQPFSARRWMPLVAASDLPVVVTPSVFYLQFQYYAPLDMQWRIHYLANPPYALLLDRSDSGDAVLLNFAKAIPRIYVPLYDDFLIGHKKFLLLADLTGQAWIIYKLKMDGAHLELLMRHGRQLLFEVTMR
jgi:hypothetical protein